MRSTTADELPLASFVLRVRGRPATLAYELHDLRTGERHRFRRAEALAAFLRARGLPVEPLQGDDDGLPR